MTAVLEDMVPSWEGEGERRDISGGAGPEMSSDSWKDPGSPN